MAGDSGAFDHALWTPLTEGLGVGDSASSPSSGNRRYGLVDELAIWDVALTADQIRTHYLEFENGYGLVYIPEPGTMLPAGLAVAGLGGYVRRRRPA